MTEPGGDGLLKIVFVGFFMRGGEGRGGGLQVALTTVTIAFL